MDIQVYTDKAIIESEANASLVTLSNVDLSEIVSQVPVGDLLEHMEYSDVMDYYAVNGDE